jgi:iron-sulfur cluster repair protein YtfE (RIC family)
MLRDKNLVPLSRQHQHALALCVRIDRSEPGGDLEPWQAEIQLLFEQEISVHFEAEEKEVFPVAERFAELKDLVSELRAEHLSLRKFASRAVGRSFDEEGLRKFGEMLSAHVRKEERQLFEGMQARMSAEELSAMGVGLERELAAASDACILPSEATRLLGKK